MPTGSSFVEDYLTGRLAPDSRFRGANNGFFTYDVPSADSGVVDSRPTAFSSFFNTRGQTDTPAFDAMTDMYRSSFAPLAQRVQKNGDWAAVQALENNESRLRGLRHLYDIGRAAGVNDRTAAAGVRATLRLVDQLGNQLGSSDMAFADRYQSYITGQALNRGYDVEDLEAEEGEMDDAFSSALSASRAHRLASGSPGSSRYSDMLSETQGSSAMLSLRARSALQDYERRHGLYSLEDRIEVLNETAKLVDRVHSNEALRRKFAGRMDRLVDMAAKKVLEGDATPNAFDRIDGAIASITDGYVTFSGNTYSDMANGFAVRDSKGRVVTSGLASLVQKGLMDQAVDDEVYGYDAPRRAESLRKRFAGLLSSYFRREAMGVDPSVANDVYGRMADKLVDMDGNGHIDLSKLAEVYVPFGPTASTVPNPEPVKDTKVFGSMFSAGEQVLDELIGSGRPGVYGGVWGIFGDILKGSGSPAAEVHVRDVSPSWAKLRAEEMRQYTDPQAVRARVGQILSSRFSDDGVSPEDAKLHAATVAQMTDWLTKTVVDINTMESKTLGADPKNYLSDEDVRNVKERALRSAVANLVISSRLAEIGFKDVPALSFLSTGNPDKSPLRNYADRRTPYANAFTGLVGYLRDYVGKADPDKLTDLGDYARYHTALSLLKGLEATVESGMDVSKTDKRLQDVKRGVSKTGLGMDLFDGFSVDALNKFNPYALSGVKDAIDARKAEALAATVAARDTTGTEFEAGQRMLNRILSRGFSDKTNPVFDERMKEMAASFMEQSGPRLSGATKDAYLDQVMDAVWTAMHDIGVLVEADGRDGKGRVVAFDPLALSLGRTSLEDRVKKMIDPVLASVSRASAEIERRNLDFQAAKTTTVKTAQEQVKSMVENGQLADLMTETNRRYP